MGKIKKSSNNSRLISANITFNKNSSFNGVESKKSPKSRRKSIATILPTPFKHKSKRAHLNEWVVSKTVDDLIKKKKKSEANTTKEGQKLNDSLFLSTTRNEKKRRKISVENSIDKTEDNFTAIPIIKQKKKVKKLKETVTGTNGENKSKASPSSISISKEKKIVAEKVTDKPDKSSCSTTLKRNKATKEPAARSSINDLQTKFNVKVEDVEKAVEGVIKFRNQNPKLKGQLFEERCPLFLQLNCGKIPRGPSKILRIPLPHSILTPEDEICLIVPEVKGIKNIEHEKHVEHYEELLRNKGVTNIKKIMTCHELRTEHETFEQRSRLVDLYNVFLVDGKVSGKVVKKCGKSFYKKRKVPIPVKLQASKLKENFEKSLSKVFFFLHLKGDSYTVQFGHNKMEIPELVQNIYSIIDFLDKEFPGGFANIRGMQVYAPRATSIPIYLSLKSTEAVVPKVKLNKPKAYKTYKDELTTLYNATVTVKPEGEVLVKRIKVKGNRDDENMITDLDIIKENSNNEENENDRDIKKKKSRKRKQNSEGAINGISTREEKTEEEKGETVIKKKKIARKAIQGGEKVNIENKTIKENISLQKVVTNLDNNTDQKVIDRKDKKRSKISHKVKNNVRKEKVKKNKKKKPSVQV